MRTHKLFIVLLSLQVTFMHPSQNIFEEELTTYIQNNHHVDEKIDKKNELNQRDSQYQIFYDFLVCNPNIVHLQNQYGQTLLHFFAMDCQDKNVTLLCDFKADQNIQDMSGSTPLHYAACNNSQANSQLLQSLLDCHADVNIQDCRSNTPLHLAVIHQNLAIVQTLLKKNTINIQIKNNHGNTPLHRAIFYKSNLEIVQSLVQSGGNTNIQNNQGKTPLHYAASQSNVTAVKILLQNKKTNTNVQNRYGNTPLHDATQGRCNPEIIKLFIHHGADVTIENEMGKTPEQMIMSTHPRHKKAKEILTQAFIDKARKTEDPFTEEVCSICSIS